MIKLHPSTPPKPAEGSPCNGCGLCCAVETCPVGRVIFLRRRGPCPALIWDDAAGRYWCGMVRAPEKFLKFLPHAFARRSARLFRRWIAADIACDSPAEPGDYRSAAFD